MKILFVTRGYPQDHNNNLGIFERDQAIALKKAGVQIAYAVVDIRSIRKRRKYGYNHFVDENGLDVFEMNWPIGPMPRQLIEYFRQQALFSLYPHILEEFGKPDILHSHFLNYGVIAVKLSKREKLPLVITEHSSFMNNPKLSVEIRNRAIKTYSACDKIIAVSNPLAKNIKKTTGFDSVVVHNIANLSYNGEPLYKDSSCEKIEFVSSGNLLPRKGFDVLLRSFANVYKYNNETSLIIFGDGPEKKKLSKLARGLSIENVVNFYGKYRKEDLPELYKNANAFVLASRGETFGVVYIEAMSLGLPVIATKCGGPEDYIDDTNGYLVDVDSVEQLSKALSKMIENWSNFDRKRIMMESRRSFSSEVIADQLIQIYVEILEKTEK